jgi:hypothetical protein
LNLVFFHRKKEKEDNLPELMNQQMQAQMMNRYRSLPHNKLYPEEEVYDEIREDQGHEYSYADTQEAMDNKGYVVNESRSNHPDNSYLTPRSINDAGRSGDPYVEPVSRQNTDNGNPDANYTILPAVTLPIDKVNPRFSKQLASSTTNDGYVDARNLNIPYRPGKKISISEQGDVKYYDIARKITYQNIDAENTTYLSLSHSN